MRSSVDRIALRGNGTRRRLQNLDYLQASHAIGDRGLAAVNARNEVLGFRLQCLLGRQMRRPHISRAIPDPELKRVFVEPFTVIPLSYTLIFSVASTSS